MGHCQRLHWRWETRKATNLLVNSGTLKHLLAAALSQNRERVQQVCVSLRASWQRFPLKAAGERFEVHTAQKPELESVGGCQNVQTNKLPRLTAEGDASKGNEGLWVGGVPTFEGPLWHVQAEGRADWAISDRQAFLVLPESAWEFPCRGSRHETAAANARKSPESAVCYPAHPWGDTSIYQDYFWGQTKRSHAKKALGESHV